jgi:hypothetical protein
MPTGEERLEHLLHTGDQAVWTTAALVTALRGSGSPAQRTAVQDGGPRRQGLDDAPAAELLSGAGFDEVRNLPTPPGAPALTAGRRPAG